MKLNPGNAYRKLLTDRHGHLPQIAIGLLVFIAAFVPRFVSPGTMLTADERLWPVRSPNFINAPGTMNLTGTYQHVHQGVTLMWMVAGRYLTRIVRARKPLRVYAAGLAKPALVVLLLLAATFVILWPAIWVAPPVTPGKYLHGAEWAMYTPNEPGGFFPGGYLDGQYPDCCWIYEVDGSARPAGS